MTLNTLIRILPGILFALLLATGAARATEMVIPDGTKLDFTVLRDGKPVGTHLMHFSNNGDGLGVHIKTDVEVKFAFIPVYHFNHESQELWRDGKLAKLDSRTDDDGKKHTLSVAAGASALNVICDGAATAADPAIVPASLWNPGTARVGDTRLLNTLDGHPMAVNVRYVGEESVEKGEKSVKAQHFVVSGELERELWYDAGWMLVKTRFKGSDGSDIQYVLR
jgi:hypothetical protein